MFRALNSWTCAFEFIFLFYLPLIFNGHCSAIGYRRDSVTILFDFPVTRTRDPQLPVHSPGFITVKYDVDIGEKLNTC